MGIILTDPHGSHSLNVVSEFLAMVVRLLVSNGYSMAGKLIHIKADQHSGMLVRICRAQVSFALHFGNIDPALASSRDNDHAG